MSKEFFVRLSNEGLPKEKARVGTPNTATIETFIANVYKFDFLAEWDLQTKGTFYETLPATKAGGIELDGELDIHYEAPVYTISAGPDITVLCTQQFYLLKANVNFPISVTWTQISGAPIRIVSPHDINTQVIIGQNYTPNQPLILRVTIDSRPHIYDDVEIVVRLQSKLLGGGLHTIRGEMGQECNEVTNYRKYTFYPNPPTSLNDSRKYGDKTKSYITWDGPSCQSDLFYSFNIYENTTGQYTPITRLYENTAIGRQLLATPNRHYCIDTTFKLQDNYWTRKGDPFYLFDEYRSSGISTDDHITGSNHIVNNSYSKIPLTFYIGTVNVNASEPLDGATHIKIDEFEKIPQVFWALYDNYNLMEVMSLGEHYTVSRYNQENLTFYTGGILV